MKAFEITTLYTNGSSNKTMKKYIVISTSTPHAMFAFKKQKIVNEEILKVEQLAHGVIIDGHNR